MKYFMPQLAFVTDIGAWPLVEESRTCPIEDMQVRPCLGLGITTHIL